MTNLFQVRVYPEGNTDFHVCPPIDVLYATPSEHDARVAFQTALRLLDTLGDLSVVTLFLGNTLLADHIPS